MATHDIVTFTHAPGQDRHANYFAHLESALRLVLGVFTCASEDKKRTFEAIALRRFCRRLLNTVEALRLKYTYNPSDQLSIDLCDSGFPSFMNFDGILLDLRSREARLGKLPDADTLKSDILDRLLKARQDPKDLLWRLSERSYLELLDPEELFLPFTPGKLQLNVENGEMRNYSLAWNCFDEATNRPIVYIMNFDQDVDEPPLGDGDVNYASLIEAIRRHSTGDRGLLFVAAGIDETLGPIHPKLLKRIRIGPICSLDYSKDPADLYALLEEYGEPGETAVQFDDEIIMSIEQKRSSKLWSLGKVREVFLVPETDLECYTRKASRVHHYLILPHRIRQVLDLAGAHNAYRNYTIIPYSGGNKGEIHVTDCTELFADR
jgi:hypothetical protein